MALTTHKKAYQYDTLDLNVFTEASTRKTRIPYTKHQHSLLTVVPFSINDNYDIIMQKASKPQIEPSIRANIIPNLMNTF